MTSAGGPRPAVCQLGNGAIDSAADASLPSGASEPNVGGTPADASSDEDKLDSDQGADEEDGDDRDATTEAAGGGGGEKVEGATELIALTASTGSTNSADDFAHRGGALRDMPYYIYRMYLFQELGEQYATETLIQSQRYRLAAQQADNAKKRRLTATQR